MTSVLWENLFLALYVASIRYSVGILYWLLFGSSSGPEVLATSYYLIPFISMVLAKSSIGYVKRLKAIAAEITVLLFDFSFADLGLTTILVGPGLRRDTPAALSTVLQILYVTIELSLPFVLWFTVIARDYVHPVGLEARPLVSGKEGTLCPICKKEKAGLVDHIRSVHGEKSLRSWKVKRFLTRNGSPR